MKIHPKGWIFHLAGDEHDQQNANNDDGHIAAAIAVICRSKKHISHLHYTT